MSEHGETPDTNPTSFLNVVAGLILLGVIAVAIWFASSRPAVHDVSEADFRNVVDSVDVQRLQKEREKKYGDPDLASISAEIETLREQAEKANLMQFDMKGAKAVHDARVATTYAANEVITEVDMAGFMAAGRQTFEGCREGFEELLKALRDGELELAQARQDPGEKFEKYRKNCGKAYPALERHGIVQGGEWVNPDVGPHVFDILNRLRWAGILDMRERPSQQITPYELELFTIWRSGTGALPAERRVQLVQRAASVSDAIPAQQIIGNIYFEAGMLDRAVQAYKKACKENPTDAMLQAKCSWIEGRARGEKKGTE